MATKTSEIEKLRKGSKLTEREKLSKEKEIEDLNGRMAQLTVERTQLNSRNTQLQAQNQDLKNENKKLSAANAQSKKHSNYASAAFIVAGTFAVVASLTMPYLAVCVTFAIAASVSLMIGGYGLYKANTTLSDVKTNQMSLPIQNNNLFSTQNYTER